MTTWSDERFERLKELWAAGWSASRIARELNVSRNAVIGKAHRDKLYRRLVIDDRLPAQPGGPAAGTVLTRGRKAPLIKPRAKWEPKEQLSFSNNRISIEELRDHHCRWIHNDGMYCGNPKNNNSSYCLQHHSICFRARA